MRWERKPEPKYRWKFLLWPTEIDGTVYWLEWVQYQHRVIDDGTWAGGGNGIDHYLDRHGVALGSVNIKYG